MSDLDLPESMRPKLAAIETCIDDAYEDLRIHGRKAVEDALTIGRQLTAAKAFIVPGQWERWCDTALPFSPRWARGLMKMATHFDTLPSPKQTDLLESTTSVQSAMRVLQPETVIGPEVTSAPDGQIAPDDPENADSLPWDTQTDEQIPKPDCKSEPPEPDPWQPVRREVATVYRDVAAAFERLKNQIAIARGFTAFDFVSTVIEQDLANLWAAIGLAKPVAECPDCRAQTPEQAKGCRTCKAIGLVPKHIAERGR